VGFNLSHDWFQLTKEYNILSEFPRGEVPQLRDYMDVSEEHPRDWCLKPYKACDLMVIAQQSELQGAMGQDDIAIRRVPKVLAEKVVGELIRRVEIPEIYFSGYKTRTDAQWTIVPLNLDKSEITDITSVSPEEICPDFVNLKLKFNPSLSLKNLIKATQGIEVTSYDELHQLPRPEEYGYYPGDTSWHYVFGEYRVAWKSDPERLKYARNDVVYTRSLWEYLGRPTGGDVNSTLTCLVGGSYWRGYDIDLPEVRNKIAEIREKTEKYPINVNSPRDCLRCLQESCTPAQKVFIKGTDSDTLFAISSWDGPVGKMAREITEQRTLRIELKLLEKLLHARRLYAMFKVVGAKSNRMSGGSLESRGGSINPQGVKRGSYIRSLFTFINKLLCPDYQLDGGDFDGFEISIAEAVFNDPDLRRDLLSGLKFHGIFGSIVYNKTYDEILATKEEENGLYNKSKTGDFAWFYGAETRKLSETLELSEEEIFEAIKRIESRYPGIRKAREELYKRFMALRQPNGIGTPVEWVEPEKFVESFLGWKRWFTLEFQIIRSLFEMANDPSDELTEMGKHIKVVRRDRQQTASGAARSAIFGAAFGLMSRIMRAANNHRIQSPGAEITKNLQVNIWEIQPVGIHQWLVQPFNVHDEILSVNHKSVVSIVAEVVRKTVESYRDRVPLISMKWKQNLKDWGEK
jgi:hypothetical protein